MTTKSEKAGFYLGIIKLSERSKSEKLPHKHRLNGQSSKKLRQFRSHLSSEVTSQQPEDPLSKVQKYTHAVYTRTQPPPPPRHASQGCLACTHRRYLLTGIRWGGIHTHRCTRAYQGGISLFLWVSWRLFVGDFSLLMVSEGTLRILASFSQCCSSPTGVVTRRRVPAIRRPVIVTGRVPAVLC